MSLGILAMGTMGGISAFLLLNRYAANLRNMSVARALCQERIEQVLTLHFQPSASTLPLAPSSDPSQGTGATCAILGTAANYSSGVFTGGSNYQTSSETIPVYTQSDGTTANASANVTYVRTTTVSPAVNVPTLNLLVFTVNVAYTFHGQPYSTSMTTLRGSN